jgi:hypothetical protein
MGSGIRSIGGQVGSGVALLRATGLFSHDAADIHRFDETRTSHDLPPAAAMAEAVLMTAAMDLASRGAGRREAEAWVDEQDPDGVRPFSLDWCCGALEIEDVGAMRELLRFVQRRGAPLGRTPHHRVVRRHRDQIVLERPDTRRRTHPR